jgi:alkanesulfonate monooxygenase
MAGTFQNLSGGRLLLNVVTGGESHEQRMYGDFLDKDARYERCGEFLAIVRALWSGKPVEFEGRHFQLSDAVPAQLPDPLPGIYFGGSSPAALDVAAAHADVYLTWGEPPAAVAEKVRRVREPAERQGRSPAFITEFVLSGYPHLEEAYRFGEGVLPELSRRGLWRHPAPGGHAALTVPFGAVPAGKERIA